MFFKSYISHLIAILFMVISLSSFSQEYSEKNIINVANSIDQVTSELEEN